MSTVYQDGTTPLDAAHMNALQQKVEKGQANGYASLDGSGKVPVAQALPTVVNGQWLKGVGGAAVWSPLAAYGTSLPASPLDGDEAVLVDSTTNPSYQWRFRYNAGSSSAYKWEFVGGAPKIFNYDQGGAGTNNAAFTQSGGWYWWNNPSGSIFLVPRSGDYRVLCKQESSNSTGATAIAVIAAAYFPTATTINISQPMQGYTSVVANGTVSLMTAAILAGTIGGSSYVGMAWQSIAVFNIYGVYIEITPIRVS